MKMQRVFFRKHVIQCRPTRSKKKSMYIQAGYNGLTALTPGLPAEAYYDPRQYDLEMRRIWRRNWVYVGRSSEVSRPRSFVSFELGDQRILLVRDDQGALR